MNREGIRTLTAEELQLKTSPYAFASSLDQLISTTKVLGFPCVIKPIMSSSGNGQSVARYEAEVENAWKYAQEGSRSGEGKVIVEGFINFDYEITLLTVRHRNGVSFCEPIDHRQEHGDYQESWQSHPMPENTLKRHNSLPKKL